MNVWIQYQIEHNALIAKTYLSRNKMRRMERHQRLEESVQKTQERNLKDETQSIIDSISTYMNRTSIENRGEVKTKLPYIL